MSGDLRIPELCLVALIGPSGAGKSTFAARHFRSTEVVSSDACRALVADDESDQSVSAAAFEILHTIAAKRLEAGRLVVADATSVRPDDRRPLVELARRHHVFPIAIVLDLPIDICVRRNEARPDRAFGAPVVVGQHRALHQSIRNLQREGWRRVYVLRTVEEVEAATIVRERLWTDRRDLTGPFDVIGDVHGCHDELVRLLRTLGWQVDEHGTDAVHPAGRTAVFLGDLVDRGPASPAVLRLAMNLAAAGRAICLPGNHESKLQRALAGKKVMPGHGLAETLAQLATEPEPWRREVERWLDGLVSHAVLDGGALVVAHAGLPESMHGRASAAVRAFSLYGDTTGETDAYGLPVRYPWADDYRGRAAVVYGHTPVPEAEWVNGTICIDTGCVFGGRLTALRWPERELVSVEAARTYYAPARPLEPVVSSPDPGRRWTDDRPTGQLDIDDVLGRRRIETALGGTITIWEPWSAAALEVMGRFAVDPRWLVYLPPTMAPCATSARSDLLEHPDEAFAAFRSDGVDEVVAEEKHMGSRAVVIVCRDATIATRRFGVPPGGAGGAIVTRTGRPFFAEPASEAALLERVRRACERSGLWDELGTGWLVLDAELLPWSAKADDLLRTQYAPVGAAAGAALRAEANVMAAAAARLAGSDAHEVVNALAARAGERIVLADRFVEAYRRYMWPVDGIDGIVLAPFQVLAGEGRVHARTPHPWHLDVAARLADADPAFFRATASRQVSLGDADAVAGAVAWWEELTAAGGEGIVVKPRDGIVRNGRRLVTPGVKCRGREYLRIIDGAEYTAPEQIGRLRDRALHAKRTLAQAEFALGIEALDRFVAGAPLHRVHECVFGVLALESRRVDPRL